jgi:phosphoesterase RecJ-like protein
MARIGPVFPVLTAFGLIIEKVYSPLIILFFGLSAIELLLRNYAYLYKLFKIGAVTDLVKYTKELSKFFSTYDNILLVCHINPDGDAIGSQLALYHFLRSKGKNVSMLAPNYLQEFLKWMTGSELIQVFISNRKKARKTISEADLIVMLDFNKSDRLGEAEKSVLSSKAFKVIIDHHLDPGDFADMIISEPSRCSTSEIVDELVCRINKGRFSEKAYTEAIYVGIITDTGNFEHGNYSSNTLRIVADLMDLGIDRNDILMKVYNNFSADRMKLLGYALNERMVILPELNSAYIFLTKDDLKQYNHLKGDTEGFVNLPLSIKGIVFSALFIEKDGFVKLSFRSRGAFPVNEFASEYFNGGGHMNASGGEYAGTLQETIDFFLETLRKNYRRFSDNFEK